MTAQSDGDRPPGSTPSAGLLTTLMTNTLDEDYQLVASRRAAVDAASPGRDERPGLWRHAGAIAAVTALGVLLGVSALKTSQDRPQALAERAGLIEAIQARQARLDGQHAGLASLQTDVGRLQADLADDVDTGSRLSADLARLGVNAGTVAATGPGMVLTLDDARHGAPGVGGVILDRDLQSLVNGLWIAGAEAIAVDGHRLTALTSIRFAGRAITVDYRSLTPPYVVEAIGDPDTLPSRLLETQGGQLWLGLRANFGITFDTQTQSSITLPGDAHDRLLWAEPAGSR